MTDTAPANMKSEAATPLPDDYIPLSVPEIGEVEWKYVKESLDTKWVSSAGTFVDDFEEKIASYTDTKYGVATVNGTAALHVALSVAGVEPEDEVLVSTLTFIAPVNAIRYVGAWPVFMDAEPDHWQMDPQKVQDFLRTKCRWNNGALSNKSTGRRIKAILPVHILGHSVHMDPILSVAQQFGLKIVEDASEALGAKYKDKSLGSMGDIGCFSFNGNKIITSGGGGMIVTNDERAAQEARYLTTQAKDDPIEYIHGKIGYNYRLTNIQAALGVAQMERLNDSVVAKRKIAERYSKGLEGIAGVSAMKEAPWAFSTYWLYTIAVEAKIYGMDCRSLQRRLAEARIEARPLWQPIHLSPAHAGREAYHCDVAESLWHRALSLPSSSVLTRSDQARVLSVITNP